MSSWPLVTCSPECTAMSVKLPSTCGFIVADRRDLMVATYVSLTGTAVSVTVCVCTGIPPGGMAKPASACGLGWQAVKDRQRSVEANTVSVVRGKIVTNINLWVSNRGLPRRHTGKRLRGVCSAVASSTKTGYWMPVCGTRCNKFAASQRKYGMGLSEISLPAGWEKMERVKVCIPVISVDLLGPLQGTHYDIGQWGGGYFVQHLSQVC